MIINYASSESSALEVCEEIKARAGEKGAIGVSIIIIMIFFYGVEKWFFIYHNEYAAIAVYLCVFHCFQIPIKANCGNIEEVQAMFAKINEEVRMCIL